MQTSADHRSINGTTSAVWLTKKVRLGLPPECQFLETPLQEGRLPPLKCETKNKTTSMIGPVQSSPDVVKAVR